MTPKLINTFHKSDLFRGIELADINLFLSNHSYKIKEYNKNDVFALAGDKVNFLMIVLQGNLIARMVSDSGKFIQIDRITEGRVVAPAMLFATENVYPVNVIPEAKVKVFFMSKEVFLKAMNKNETLLYNFIRIVSDINRFLSSKIHLLSLKSIRGKLAGYILELLNEVDHRRISLPLSRQELADKFGISRQALSRSLTELETEGLIHIEGRSILVINKQALEDQE